MLSLLEMRKTKANVELLDPHGVMISVCLHHGIYFEHLIEFQETLYLRPPRTLQFFVS